MNMKSIIAVLACVAVAVAACPEAEIHSSATGVTFTLDGTPVTGLESGAGVHVVTLNPYSLAVLDNAVFSGAGAGLPAFLAATEMDAIVLVGSAGGLGDLSAAAAESLGLAGAMMAGTAAPGAAYALVGRRGDGAAQLDAVESTAESEVVLTGTVACKGSTANSPSGCPVNFQLVNGVSCSDCTLESNPLLGPGGFAGCAAPTCSFYNPAAQQVFSGTGMSVVFQPTTAAAANAEAATSAAAAAVEVAAAAELAANLGTLCEHVEAGTYVPHPMMGFSAADVSQLLTAYCAAERGVVSPINVNLSAFSFTPAQATAADAVIASVTEAPTTEAAPTTGAPTLVNDVGSWLTLRGLHGVASVGIASTWDCYEVVDAHTVIPSVYSAEVVLFDAASCAYGREIMTVGCDA